MSDAATVSVHRTAASYRDRLVAYAVLLDDEVIGSVKMAQAVNFIVEPGPHRLRLRVMGKFSPELRLDLAPAEVAAFECGPAASSPSALYRSFFRRNDYITLRPRC